MIVYQSILCIDEGVAASVHSSHDDAVGQNTSSDECDDCAMYTFSEKDDEGVAASVNVMGSMIVVKILN